MICVSTLQITGEWSTIWENNPPLYQHSRDSVCSANRWGSYMLWSDLAFERNFYLRQLDSQIPSKWSTYYKKCWQGQCQSGSLFLVIPWWLKVRMPNSLLFCSKCSIDSIFFFLYTFPGCLCPWPRRSADTMLIYAHFGSRKVGPDSPLRVYFTSSGPAGLKDCRHQNSCVSLCLLVPVGKASKNTRETKLQEEKASGLK